LVPYSSESKNDYWISINGGGPEWALSKELKAAQNIAIILNKDLAAVRCFTQPRSSFFQPIHIVEGRAVSKLHPTAIILMNTTGGDPS